MLPEQQQRILGYFIEEAKDHLNTIEQGLLNLQATIVNPEMANEVFRAAHSVKGGAAMLGIESMQRTAHRMEDYFKLLKEAPIKIDRSLESMFLRVFDALQELLEQLQGPFGLTEDKEQSIMTSVEPVFQQLQEHLDQLVAEADANEAVVAEAQPVVFTARSPQPVEESALKLVFSSDVSAALREMLARFKQADTDESRLALEACCQLLERFGEQFNLPTWMNLVKHARWAVCDRNNDYRTLAPALIKEIKKSQDLVLAGREPEINISEKLQTLAAQGDITDTTGDLESLFADSTPDTSSTAGVEELSVESDLTLNNVGEPSSANEESISLDDLLNSAAVTPSGPEVGDAELTSLADLFEAGGDDLDSDWQEEELPLNEGNPPVESLDIDIAPDFEDLLNEDATELETNQNDFESGSELADLFGDTDSTESADSVDTLDNSGLENLTEQINTSSTDIESPLSEDLDTSSIDSLFDDIDTANDSSGVDELFGDLDSSTPDDVATTADNSPDIDELFGDLDSSEEAADQDPSLELSDSLDDFDELALSETNQGEELVDSDLDLDFESPSSSDELASLELNLEEATGETNTDELFTNDLEDVAVVSGTDSFFSEAAVPDLDLSETVEISETETTKSEFEDFFTVNDSAAVALAATGSDPFSDDDLWETDKGSSNTDTSELSDELSQDIWDEPGQQTDTPNESASLGLSDDLSELSLNLDSDIVAATQDSNDLELDDVWASVEDVTSEIDEKTAADTDAVGLDDLFNEGDLPGDDNTALEQVTLDDALDTGLGDLDDLFDSGGDVTSADAPVGDLLGDNTALEQVTPDDALDTGLGDLDDLFDNGSDVTSADATTSDNALDNLLGDADIALDSTVENNADELLTDLDLDNLELDEPETNLSDVDLSLELGSNLNDVSSTASELLNEELDEPETNLSDVDLSLELGSDLNDASSTESELLNEPPVSTFDFDLLDIEDDGIVTGFVNEDEKPESLEKPIETDTIDNLEIFEPSSDEPGLESLDSLLSELPEEIDEFSASTATTDSSNEFGELEALLESPDNLPEPSSESPSTTDLDDEFGDLEALLQDTDKTLAPAAASGTSTYRPRPTSNRLSARRMVTDQTMRVSVSHLDNLSNLVGELVVNRNTLEQDQDRLRQFLDNLLFQVQQLNDVGQRMRDLYERSLLESSLISSRQSYHMTSASFSVENSDIEDHATGESFDALEMDRFTGFHTLSQEMIELIVRVRESASDIAYTVESSDQVTRQFRQVTNQLQEGLNKARMVPFAQTASRLPRAVRDISLKCGKEARLVVEGRDILIDKMILEQLYDPMTHLVNNAITHGIETPEERHQAGKSSEGLITVRAFYQGNQTVISVGDDGAGIDPDIVKQKALQKGLISQSDAHTMTVLDVYDLLFHPGFSTRDQADDFAGRGFGMDVVRTSLADIRGNITIDSEPGHGTNFTIRLPLTLSISKALSCISNQARIAFPMDGVEDMFDVSRERIQKNDQGEDCILWRDTLLPFQNLSDLLSFNRTLGRGRVYGGNQDENMISIVVLRSANSFIALEVDQVMGEQEIVIKQLEGPVPKPTGIAGATVLGDGRVMPIADVLELIDLAMGRVRREPNAALWAQSEDTPPEEPAKVKSEPTVLIVDDSITVRELLSMSFNKVGYRVEQARDGQEAWEKLRSGLPCDLVFCDIEMPRMDGLELLSRLQKDDGLQQIPIAMLTSRGADRHRQMAVDLGASGYFTKPYLEEALLDAANKMLHGEKLV
ncbi:response regulator [Leptothoe sp. LEGE 181152]|nr:response regulator [Leptothoe sp. LEGE 181152]